MKTGEQPLLLEQKISPNKGVVNGLFCCAGLSTGKYGPGLLLIDENGKTRAEMSMTKLGPQLVMYDKQGTERSKMSAYDMGISGQWLNDGNGNVRVGLFTSDTGPRIQLWSAKRDAGCPDDSTIFIFVLSKP